MRARRFGLLAVVAASALVAGACTGHGDIEVLVDDGTDPSVLLGEAIDRTVRQSGRLTQTMVWDFGAVSQSLATSGIEADDGWDDGPSRVEFTAEGEFDGGDLLMDMTVDDGDGSEQGTWMVVGGAEYRTVDPQIDEELIDSLGGRTWIELPEWERIASTSDADSDATDPFVGIETPGDLAGSLDALRELIDPIELEPGEIEGVAHRRLRGRVDLRGTTGLFDGEHGPELDPDERARWERIEAYRAEHQGTDVEVWIDGDGFVRRLVMTQVDEVEPQYRECFHLYSMGMSTQVDLFDLGEQMDITAPDPADVMPAEEYEQLTEFDGYVEDVATTTIVGGAWDQDDPDGMTPDGGVSDLEPGSVSWDTDMFAGCPA